MLEFRRFFGVSQRWVPRRVPYAAFSRFFSIYLEPEKIFAAYADDGEHEVLAIVSGDTVSAIL